MSCRKRTLFARTAAAGLAVLSGAALFSPTFAAGATSDVHSNVLIVNHQTWRNVPYVTAGGTTYFGIWYLQQLLSQYGIENNWDGSQLHLSELPAVTSEQTVLNGQPIAASPILAYAGERYVNLSAVIHAAGGSTTYIPNSQTLAVSLPAGSGVAQATVRQAANQPGLNPLSTDSTEGKRVQIHGAAVNTGASVYENGQLWKRVPIVYRNGTTFFGVWYLQQWLDQHGIQNQWDGKRLSVGALPSVHAHAKLQSNGRTTDTTLISLGSAWYAPMSALHTVGLSAQVDVTNHHVDIQSVPQQSGNVTGRLVDEQGQPLSVQLAVSDATGNIASVHTDSQGRFAIDLPSASGTLIGISLPNQGWIGQSVVLQGAGQTYTLSTTGATTTIQGRLNFQGAPFAVKEVSVRNRITHAHYYASVNGDGSFSMTVPAGGYETFALVGDGSPVFLVDPFVTTSGSTLLNVSVPPLPSGMRVTTAHATIVAADNLVTGEQLLSVSRMFEHVYNGDIQDTGISPAGKVNVMLYGSASTYLQHFVDEGYSTSYAQQIASDAVATDEGTNTISVLMPSFDRVDGMNILAHEFTHALIANVSTQIPSWANEGVAWLEGSGGESDGSPDLLLQQGLQWSQWVDIVAHQQQGTLLPLGGANPLAGDYNVESQDYYAVRKLVSQFGLPKFMEYVRTIDSDTNAFEDVFGESFTTFSAQVTASLRAQANQTDSGFTVRVRVLPGGPQQLFIINQLGQRQIISGLQAGQVYTVTCHNDGSIQVPDGLQVSSAPNLPIIQGGNWYIGSGGDGTANRQEFDIQNRFGIPFVALAILYDDQGNVSHAYPATEVPNGLQIVDVKGDA